MFPLTFRHFRIFVTTVSRKWREFNAWIWPPDCISIGGCREAGQSDGSTQITQVDFLVDEADRFGRAGEAQADALIIDLEDAVAFTDKQKARAAALQYLEQPQEVGSCLRPFRSNEQMNKDPA